MIYRYFAIAAACVVLVFALGANAPARADVEADFKAADAAYNAGKYAEAERLTTIVLKADLNPQGRVRVLILRGISRNSLGKYKLAVDDFNKAFTLSDKVNKGVIRYDRLLALINLEDFSGAYKDLLVLAQSYPKDIKDVTLRNIFSVGRHLLKTERNDDWLALLLALKKANYRNPDRVTTTDYLYLHLIRELTDHQRTEDAIPLVADLSEYGVLMEISTQARYATLRAAPGISALLQPRDFAARQLATAQKVAAQNAKNLKAMTWLVEALRLNGRYDDAVRAAQDLLKAPARFDKDEESILWLKNELAYALQAQGRFVEANAVLQPLLKLDVKANSSLVNQFINLGTMMLKQGLYLEAMTTAARAHGHSSAYGEKIISYVNACALFRLGKAAQAQAILLDMLKKPEDNYEIVTDAALCLKNEGQAAAIVVKRLQDKEQANSMLSELQLCRENPKRPALARETRAGLMRVRIRAEVKLAIAPVGVIINAQIACGDD